MGGWRRPRPCWIWRRKSPADGAGDAPEQACPLPPSEPAGLMLDEAESTSSRTARLGTKPLAALVTSRERERERVGLHALRKVDTRSKHMVENRKNGI